MDSDMTVIRWLMARDFTWIAVPAAILLSAAVGWWASQRSIRHQTAQRLRENKAKRSLVFQLLGDEIDLRWKGEIEPYLRGLLEKSPVEALQLFAEMELKPDDVFTLKTVSASFSDYFFIGNDRLVSQIVHGYLLVCDLIDFRSVVARTLSERRDMHDRLRPSTSEQDVQERLQRQYGGDITKFWKDFQTKLDAIAQRFDEIRPQLSWT